MDSSTGSPSPVTTIREMFTLPNIRLAPAPVLAAFDMARIGNKYRRTIGLTYFLWCMSPDSDQLVVFQHRHVDISLYISGGNRQPQGQWTCCHYRFGLFGAKYAIGADDVSSGVAW